MSFPTRLRPLALSLMMAALAVPLGLQAQSTAAAGLQAQSTAAASAEAVGRVIVRFKPGAQSVRAQALSAQTAAPAARQIAQTRARGLGLRTGLLLSAHHNLDERTQVVLAKGLSSEALAARLAKDGEVEFVAVDQLRRRAALPNDPLYPLVNPAQGSNGHGQWYLMPPTGEVVSSINAQAAWDRSTGSSSVVVAVLDTGVRYDHPDLSGKLIAQGYDMIGASTSSADAVAVANDGDLGDADASDPGDWVSQADIDAGTIGGCTAADIQDSSWHGTRVSGLIGATANNGLGIAGVSWGSRILPVRVLGKCGGYDSDIMLGMRWAAGVTAPGLPANANPAKVLNMSLGGGGSCSDGSSTAQLYNEVVAAVRAKGAVIVAAAGNSTGQAVGIPGNCSGVIAVAGLRHAGTKVGFSSLGPEVAIAAPGGNCVNATGACLYPILSTTNSGTKGPVLNDNAYTDSNPSVGTSFSAPLVSGAAALLYSARPGITPDQVRTVLTSTSRAFITPPSGSGGTTGSTPVCQAPSTAEQLECYCTTSTCGAGMVDANAAVHAVAPVFSLSTSPASAQAGQGLTLSLSSDGGRSLKSYSWSVTDGASVAGTLSGASTASPTLTPTAAGSFTVKVDLVDDLGLSHSYTGSVTVAAASSTGSGSSGGGGGGLMNPGWLLGLLAAVPLLRRQRRR